MKFFIGYILAFLLVQLSIRFYSEEKVRKIGAIALLITALIYPLFAIKAQSWEWLPLQLLGVLIYAIPAYLGFRGSNFWLWLGWSMHLLWDLFAHPHGATGFMPQWHHLVCIGLNAGISHYFWRRTYPESTL